MGADRRITGPGVGRAGAAIALAVVLATAGAIHAATPPASAPPAATATATAPTSGAAAAVQSSAGQPAGRKRPNPRSPYLAARHSQSAETDTIVRFGMDKLRVQSTASGSLIRFSYHVIDAQKAKVVADKAATAYMVAPAAGVVLQVPVMEKVGPLRQTNEVVPGKDYWMVFSNKGSFVKPGDRVTVIVGNFRVDGLVVQP